MRTWCGAILAAAVALGVDAGELKPGEVVSGFAVRSVTPLPEAGGRLVRMTYEKNGADLAWLDRDDDNKTFAIAFRTIPGDDTGVAHIIEHSVLCGSEKYPVKEPFVEMLKSSFSTYLNAWTGSDCTAYPVCSRNGADFLNLMDVYLDAVFHPLSVKSPLAFRQEGWHYEFKDGELVRNGVVLNEMRGCYGSPDRLAWHMLGRLLFPGNCYGRESGGDPAQIHELTWGKYRAFYRRHYHPSNARIFLDGRIDLAATLARLDAVLSAYPRAEISSPNPVQRPVRAEKTAEYEIGAEESAADKTLYLEGWVFGTFRDRETQMGLEVLADALADSNEAPLKKALLSKGLCENVWFDVDCDEQISVRLCAKNVKDGKADEVRRVVRETLESIARDGVDKARLGALIDRREFRYREMDYGGFPRGLVFLRRALGQWLYGGDPADAMRGGHVYSGLRSRARTGWFEDLLRMAVIDNPHHATLTLVPSKALGEERRRAEKAELAAIQAKWTPEERERVMAECRALDEFQKKVDSPEDLSKLPRLSLGDIPEDGPVPEYSETSVGGVRVIRAKTSANGIAYLKLYFELAGCSGEDLSDASALSDVIGDLPTAKRGVMELKNALDAGLGRFQTSTQTFAKPGDPKHAKAYFVVSVSALDAKLGEIARLVPEVLLESSFADANLVGDIVKQRRRGIEETLMGVYGSGFASRRALASQSVQGAMEEHFGGIAFLRRLQRIDDGFAADGAAYCRRLEALSRRVFVRAGLTACLSDNVPTEWLGGLFGRFPEGGAAEPSQIQAFAPVREGFRTAGKVGAAAKASFPDAYSGSGCVAANMLTLDYLWNEIRVQGGAYGGGFAVRLGGEARYNSWNDPKPARSLGVYDGSGDALRRLVQGSSSIDNYIISAVSATEPYLSPSVETSRAAALVLSGRTPEDLRRVRREMLRTTKGDILRFAGVLDSITNSTSVCVVGGAAQVEACSNLLDRVESVATCVGQMLTQWGETVTSENCWRGYPRPQMVREGWTNLNGDWDYAVTSVTNTPGRPEKWEGKIRVPFPIESALSGVGRLLKPDEFLWYTRKIVCDPRPGERILLHFGGVDFRTMVFIGHDEVTDVPHEGGQNPFTLDITDYVKSGENELTVCVWDPTEGFVNSRGKQSFSPKGCFYTRVSGIWQTVWMETVPEKYIKSYKVFADIDKGTVRFEFDKVDGAGEVEVTTDMPSDFECWSPENPRLYGFTAKYGRDVVKGYFGMRKFEKRRDEKGVPRFFLNNRPYFPIGTLDQGWWPDGLLTPPSEEAMEYDVRVLKDCGFNMLRKHIKVEPQSYYAMCDRLGILVIQDLPSGTGSWADPMKADTVGRYWLERQEMKEMMDDLRPFPCIVMWNPYNEGWSQPGEFLTHSMLDFTRRYDKTRLVNGPSGCWDWEGGHLLPEGWKWEGRVLTQHKPAGVCEAADTVDMHLYRGPAMFAVNDRRISFLGEFGGLGHPVPGHMWKEPKDGKGNWGYGGIEDTKTREGLEKAYLALMDRLGELAERGLGGSVYTQTTDVEIEINGLLTYDRKVVKYNPAVLRKAHAEVIRRALEASRKSTSPAD